MNAPTIREARDDEADRSRVGELFWEYLQSANEGVNEEFNVNFDIETMLEEDMADLEKFLPPAGRLLLAMDGDHVAGIGCLKSLKPNVGELKRMYVRPAFRGRGIGRALFDSLIAEASLIGYRSIQLDSAGFMHAAHGLYRSAGFQDIDPYPESEIPPEFQKHWVFMAKGL
jgi:GNAT superfamily N-acetyltransferase